MKIRLSVEITPSGKMDVYKSLGRAEEFITRLLASETALQLARECQVKVDNYIPAPRGEKLYKALGLSHASDGTHIFSCWEEEEGRARKVRDFNALAGSNGAAEYNGSLALQWRDSGGTTSEEDAGIHLLSRNGRLVKRLWIEAERRSS